MAMDIKKRATSIVLASTLFASGISLTSCGNRNTETLSNPDKSVSDSSELKDKKTDTSSSSAVQDKSVEPEIEENKVDLDDEPLKDDSQSKVDEQEELTDDTLSLGEAERLIDPNGIGYDIRSEYNLDELYVIDASLLDESLKGKSYITTTSCYSIIDGDKNLVFVCYPSINSDFILVHQITFVNNEFNSVSYYSNISGGVSTDSNDMNTVISNAMIRPLSERTDTLVLSLEEAQELVKKINDENKLILN